MGTLAQLGVGTLAQLGVGTLAQLGGGHVSKVRGGHVSTFFNPFAARLHVLHKRAGSILHWVIQTGRYY